MPPYVVLNKRVGETPLECLEAWRSTQPTLADAALTYAGRLDPMASGKLLVLIGEECKRQADYHGLDKGYEVEVLLGVTSDSGDVLGVVTEAPRASTPTDWATIATSLIGQITLPYPAYSAKTVAGVPLHTWAVTGRLGDVRIPERTSTIHQLVVHENTNIEREALYRTATEKIALLPRVTDVKKALGNDFRRPEVLASWEAFRQQGSPRDQFSIVRFTCICSSGTYMRTLADELAKRAGGRGLAFSIHRTDIGRYHDGTWEQSFT